ncbi:MAG: hypothetical protein IK093_17290 [Ruminiclostridium sp.]|nr:hypothetical protein [Ruminiclostridium sp.]
MCTRFNADLDKELKPFVDAAQQAFFAEQMTIELSRTLSMSGEIRPTDISAVTFSLFKAVFRGTLIRVDISPEK